MPNPIRRPYSRQSSQSRSPSDQSNKKGEQTPSLQNTAPPPLQKKSEPMKSSFFGTMMEGAAFGAGSSIGHKAIDALMGNNKKTDESGNLHDNGERKYQSSCHFVENKYNNCIQQLQHNDNCEDLFKDYYDCIKSEFVK